MTHPRKRFVRYRPYAPGERLAEQRRLFGEGALVAPEPVAVAQDGFPIVFYLAALALMATAWGIA